MLSGIARRVRAAHFEQICVFEDFDFSFNPKIPAARIRDLATLRFCRCRGVGHPARAGRRWERR